MKQRPAIVVIAKSPVAGRVKTRLCPPCTPVEAAALAEASLRDSLAVVASVDGVTRAIALDGHPGAWLPSGFSIHPQRGDGLAQRLASATMDVGGPVLVIGGDTPQVTPALLRDALEQLAHTDAVLGPASDGGYWAIGLRRADARVFAGVPMSTSRTGFVQLKRLRALGYRIRLLPELRDVDYIDDAVAVARLAPTTRFAAALEALELQAFELGPALLGER